MNTHEAAAERQIVSQNGLATLFPKQLPEWITAGILSFSGLGELNRVHARLPVPPPAAANVFDAALQQLQVRVKVDDSELAHIPTTGPVIVVANHPFGGADGLALGAALMRRRTDVRFIANSLLTRIGKLSSWLLAVDILDRANRNRNAAQLRAALRHLATGGLLAVFPAGSVSHFQPNRGSVADEPWKRSVGMLVRRSRATVVPCFFEGSNSPVFHAAGWVHPGLRTLLLPRELLAKRGSQITLRIGRPVGSRSIQHFTDDETLAAWLRLRTYSLAQSTTPRIAVHRRIPEPVAIPVDASVVANELSALPVSQLLLHQGPYRVYLASHADIPRTIFEIGRLREFTFRAVGEGTGAAWDLDAFDHHYQHLVLFDAERQCIVGAYRLAFGDQALNRSGFAGLYAHTLFRFKASMRRELAASIELGRSFVSAEYQRKPLSLALLWRGIGEVLRRNPRYRRLVGPVSISDHYRGTSRRLLLSFLEELRASCRLRRLVDARHPVQVQLDSTEQQFLQRSCRTVKDLSRFMEELDDSGRRVPVLLERYLELGAEVAALSVDPDFGNCIDALIIVDLDRAPAAMLRRCMGDAGYEEWRTAEHVCTR